MRRLRERFATLSTQDEGALIGYLMAGDPTPEASLDYAEALLAGGVDVLELGVPFSDPIADGPTIQAAGVRALAAGTTPETVLAIVRELRTRRPDQTDVPIVLMSYATPIHAMGEELFAEQAREAGVDGVIVPDLPVEEADAWLEAARQHEIAPIFLATPETDEARLARVAEHSRGFLYLVGRYGVTGARTQLDDRVAELIAHTREHVPSSLPIAVGFGLAEPDHVRDVIRAGAQGAIVGSAYVRRIAEEAEPDTLTAFTRELKAATRPAHHGSSSPAQA